jgi:hypothetical protein
MTWPAALRVVAGIAVGLGLGCVPFLQYGLHGHHHATHVAPTHP